MTAPAMRTVALPSGERIPVLGQGTWGWAEQPERRAGEIRSLLEGIDLGMNLVDTAEMYANGGAEELLGEAIADRRDDVFLVSKVLPRHASRRGTVEACRRSLDRLRTDRIDLYLLHWRGRVALSDTVAAFEALVAQGSIRYWGVSNFDTADLAELERVSGGGEVSADQVLNNLTRRGMEYDLLPYCQRRGIPVMAYSPVEQGRVLGHPVLAEVAKRHETSAAQVALAWVLRQDGVCAIPKASNPVHVRENRAALELRLTAEDLATLDAAFPPPTAPQPLQVL